MAGCLLELQLGVLIASDGSWQGGRQSTCSNAIRFASSEGPLTLESRPLRVCLSSLRYVPSSDWSQGSTSRGLRSYCWAAYAAIHCQPPPSTPQSGCSLRHYFRRWNNSAAIGQDMRATPPTLGACKGSSQSPLLYDLHYLEAAAFSILDPD
jgi:hypothetical protein